MKKYIIIHTLFFFSFSYSVSPSLSIGMAGQIVAASLFQTNSGKAKTYNNISCKKIGIGLAAVSSAYMAYRKPDLLRQSAHIALLHGMIYTIHSLYTNGTKNIPVAIQSSAILLAPFCVRAVVRQPVMLQWIWHHIYKPLLIE